MSAPKAIKYQGRRYVRTGATTRQAYSPLDDGFAVALRAITKDLMVVQRAATAVYSKQPSPAATKLVHRLDRAFDVLVQAINDATTVDKAAK